MVEVRYTNESIRDRVHIYQSDLVIFTFKPFMDVLTKGFESIGIKSTEKYNNYKWEDFRQGDILIWIGRDGVMTVPWEYLKQRGVYTIYYHTEIYTRFLNTVHHHSKNINEIWTYSTDVSNSMKHSNMDCIIRYIPTGYIDGRNVIDHRNKRDLKLINLGVSRDSLDYMKNKIENLYNIWSEEALSSYITKPHVSLFVNAHYNESSHKTFESARCSNVLSSAGILISERSYHKDEEEFEPFVDFVEQKDIEKKFDEYVNMEPEKRQSIAIERYEAYKLKFNPSDIFKRANVKEILTIS
jgi:hypothetical protein